MIHYDLTCLQHVVVLYYCFSLLALLSCRNNLLKNELFNFRFALLVLCEDLCA